MKAAARSAHERETAAWAKFQEVRELLGTDEHQARLEEWTKAHEDLLVACENLLAVSMNTSHRLLRDCAEILSRLHRPGYPPPSSATAPPSRVGSTYQGRDDATWEVIELTHDAIEPELFLAQLRRTSDDRIEEVYSEDWRLFCVLHGLRGPV